MVRNYCKIIELTGADPDKVLETVRGYLFSQPYTKQKDGSVEALIQGGAHKADVKSVTQGIAARIVAHCLKHKEEAFEEILKTFIR